MYTESIPIVSAAQAKNSLTAALQYAEIGFSVLPLKGKIPSLKAWSQYQVEPATFDEIHNWYRAGLLENVGLVCGAVSNNLVVLDLDGPAGYPAFAAMFPHLSETFTVATGGGVGRHVYLFAGELPDTVRAMRTPIGHLELRANGCQIVAPQALRLDVRCWPACQAYGDRLRRMCDPRRDTELDERLKGVYGRLHVHAFKLATLFAALDWLDTDDATPVVGDEHWQNAEIVAESWRSSAHRLLDQLDRTGEAIQERRQQDSLLKATQQTGATGANLRSLYRKLHVTAKRGHRLAQDLVRAGLIIERR